MQANRKPKICVVGSANVDLIARVPRLPAPGETLVGSEFHMGFGGKGSNQAVMAARLGAETVMVTKVGRDVFGENTLENYKTNNIDTQFVFFDEERFSGVAPISVDVVTGQNSIVIVPGANMGLSPEDVAKAETEIGSSDLVVCQLEIPQESTLEAFRLARKAGVRTILNPAPAAPLSDELLALTDICIPNETETQMLTGKKVDTPESAVEAGNELRKRGPQTVIVTLGDKGAVYLTEDERKTIQAEKVEAVDSTGAGDAFVGCLAFQLARAVPLDRAIEGACAVATRTVLKTGTQTSFPWFDEVEHLLD
ncbi:MAG: ribokinase [Proteobacteria bacterium]|nr:ribokinase [Pseudomonadota bacterium]